MFSEIGEEYTLIIIKCIDLKNQENDKLNYTDTQTKVF